MRNKVEKKGKKLKKAQKKGLYATMNGWRIDPFLLYQGYRWMALCGLMGRCMARVSSVLKSTAQSYDFISKPARAFWEKFLKKLYAGVCC